MNTVKKILKYVAFIIVFYLFSKFLIYVGLNATYKDIKVEGDVPSQIEVEFAQATKVNGRIFGKVHNSQENDINGKYIKVDIYNSQDELLGTKYLQITDVEYESSKKFAVYFKKNSVSYCEVSIVDQKDEQTEKLFDGVFISEDLKTHIIISTVIYAIFFV